MPDVDANNRTAADLAAMGGAKSLRHNQGAVAGCLFHIPFTSRESSMNNRILSVALFGLLSPSGAITGGGAGKAEKAMSAEYYPLQVGTTWEYKRDNRTLETRTVTKHERFNGVMCARLEITMDGKPFGVSYIAIAKDGVYAHGWVNGPTSTHFKPPLPILKLPLKKGQRWGGAVCFGEDVVTVPTGKYKAMRVVGRDPGAQDILRLQTTTSWYAKDIGMVKEEVNDPRGYKSTKVLVNFKAGK